MECHFVPSLIGERHCRCHKERGARGVSCRQNVHISGVSPISVCHGECQLVTDDVHLASGQAVDTLGLPSLFEPVLRQPVIDGLLTLSASNKGFMGLDIQRISPSGTGDVMLAMWSPSSESSASMLLP